MVSFIPYIKFSHSMFQIKAHVLLNISAMVKKKTNLPFLPNKSKSCLYLLHRVNCEAVKKKSPKSPTHPTTCLFAHLASLFFNSPLMLSFKLPCQRSCPIKFHLVQTKSFWLESRIARLIIMLIGQFSVFFITAQLCAQDKRIQSESM